MRNRNTVITGWAALALSVAMPQLQVKGEEGGGADASRKGIELAKKRDYAGAAAEFTKAIKADPSVAHYTNRGKAYRAAGNYTEAEADFTKVIQMNSENADAYSERGKVKVSEKKYDEALADLN